MQFKIPKFGFKFKKRGNAAGFFGAKLSFISNHLSIINDKLFQNNHLSIINDKLFQNNHLSIISNKLSQNNHLSIINDKLSKKRINYKLSIFGKKLIINYKLLIAVGVLALAATGGTLALNGFFGGGAAIPEDTMTRGLVGYWSFDEGDGAIARDASGNNNHGTLTNGPQWTQGKNGGALQFDGKDDYVDCGNDASLDITDEITIETWVKPETDSVSYIVSKEILEGGTTWYGYRLDQYTGNTVRAHIWTDGDQGRNLSGAIFLNFWNHIVVTYSKNEEITKLYVNGILKDDDYTTGNIKIASSINFNIGRSNLSYPFDGLIDEVRIYNRALTEAEVKYHYNRGGPVAQWDMDEGSGSVINDKSGNNNNGTLVNGTTWVQGKHGSALSFDGTDDYVSVNDDTNFRTTGDWTRSIWVNSPVAIGGDGTTNDIWTQRTTTNKFLLRIEAAGKWALYYRSTGAGFSSFFIARTEAGVWQNIVAVKSGTSVAVYLDGKKVASATNAENFPDDSHQIYFGSAAVGMAQFFNGQIDEVKIYDYARTEEEIRLDYNAGLATHLGPSGKTCSEDPAGCMDFGLAGHWDMDEGSGSMINDKSGNNNHGTLTNGPQWTQGKNGGALQFDGKDDYVDCGSTSSLNDISGVVSVEAWARLDKLKYNSIVNKRTNNIEGHWDFRHSLNYGLQFVNFDSGGNPKIINAAATFDNNWHHLVAVATDSEVKIYMDGKRLATTGTLAPIVSTSTNVKIGGWGLTGNYYLNGDIDDVKIYNRALSAEEVRYHYNQGKPVAQWDMDEGSGSAIKDKSGNGNNGTIFGATWAQGKHGTALSFDGTDDYVDAGNEEKLQITGSITISAWVKTNSVTTFNGIVTKYYAADGKRGYALEFNPYSPAGGGLRFVLSNNGTAVTQVSTNQVLPNQWAYITGVYDGSSMKLFVDGVLRGSVSYSGGIYNTGESLFLGRSIGYASFNGEIDEVKIYDYARTEEEIRLDYNAGVATHLGPSGKTCSEDPAGCMDYGLAGHWNMDEGGGTKLNDKSGNNNHGTLTNGPKWTKGKSGGALQFDGKDDYVNIVSDPSLILASGGSAEAWIKIGSFSSGFDNAILMKGDGASWPNLHYALLKNNGENKIIFSVSDGTNALGNGGPKTPTLSANRWYHIVATWDDSQKCIYLDGILSQCVSSAIMPKDTILSCSTNIGRVYNAAGLGTYYFNGSIDNMHIYNRALSAEEVRYHYNQGKPVAQWDFDEGEGTRAFDVSGNNNTGVLTNGPTWVEGKHGSALSFDGADDSVDAGNKSNLDITREITVLAWVKPTDDTDHRTILAKEHYENKLGYLLHQRSGKNWMLRLGDGVSQYEVIKTNSVDLNEWQHIVGTYDGTTMKLYKNGEQIASKAGPNLIATTGEPLRIGSRPMYGQFFQGLIDEVKVYNYARTAEQIMQDYNAGVATHLK